MMFDDMWNNKEKKKRTNFFSKVRNKELQENYLISCVEKALLFTKAASLNKIYVFTSVRIEYIEILTVYGWRREVICTVLMCAVHRG